MTKEYECTVNQHPQWCKIVNCSDCPYYKNVNTK